MEREKLFDFLISIYWKLIIKTTLLLFYFFLTLEEIHEWLCKVQGSFSRKKVLLLSESEAVGRLKTLESRLPGTDESCFRLHKFFYVPNYQVTHAPGGARLQSCENQLPATKGERRKKMMGNKEYLLEFLRYTRSSLDVTQKGTERRRRRQEMAILFLIGNRSADERRTYRCILTHANRRYIENIPFYTACNVYIII